MRLPSDWEAERASGWWELHHLIHKPCGYRTHNAYDLVVDSNNVFGSPRQIVYGHECEDES